MPLWPSGEATPQNWCKCWTGPTGRSIPGRPGRHRLLQSGLPRLARPGRRRSARTPMPIPFQPGGRRPGRRRRGALPPPDVFLDRARWRRSRLSRSWTRPAGPSSARRDSFPCSSWTKRRRRQGDNPVHQMKIGTVPSEVIGVVAILGSEDLSEPPPAPPADVVQDEPIRLRELLQRYRGEAGPFYGLDRLVGESPAMRRVRRGRVGRREPGKPAVGRSAGERPATRGQRD